MKIADIMAPQKEAVPIKDETGAKLRKSKLANEKLFKQANKFTSDLSELPRHLEGETEEYKKD